MDKKDGGPAFPCETYHGKPVPGGDGMSLRDYFAGQALAGLLSGRPDADCDADGFAKDAYQYADAMLDEREDG